MKGDFTRLTFDPQKHYTGVLKQQGRVDLDADWNEYVEIRDYLSRTEAQDVIGLCGVPQDSNGFEIKVGAYVGGLAISPGRIYVDGILCENDSAKPVPLVGQEHLPGYEIPTDSGVYIAYLDVWKRHMTAIEDCDIREVALGGPDTTTRVMTVWQVRLEKIGELADLAAIECIYLGSCWKPEGRPFGGQLRAQAKLQDPAAALCLPTPSVEYRGLENRLYRVEIHDSGDLGKATFKWSRDNGAVVFPVPPGDINGDKVTLSRLGRDQVLTLHEGDWVEILGDETELWNKPGTLTQVKQITQVGPAGLGEIGWELVLKDDVSIHAGESHLKLRRWDQGKDAITVNSGPIELEDGVLVEFQGMAANCFQTGDYWLIPARTALRDVLWPKDGDTPTFEYRHGIHHHYCPLALLTFDQGDWTLVRDCRELFPPLTRAGGCCVVVRPGDDVQQAIDTVIEAGGGCVRLCAGLHQVDGPLLLTGAHDVTLSGVNRSAILALDQVNEAGLGGIVLQECEHISIENLFILGTGISALVDVRLGPDREPCTNIALRRLDMLNLEQHTDTGVNCAVRMTDAEEVQIEDCRLLAEVGVLCLNGLPAVFSDPRFGKGAPETEPPVTGPVPVTGRVPVTGGEGAPGTEPPVTTGREAPEMETPVTGGEGAPGTEPPVTTGREAPEKETPVIEMKTTFTIGKGVRALRMEGVQVRYREFGVWTVSAQGWQIEDCDFRSLDPPRSTAKSQLSTEPWNGGKLCNARGRAEVLKQFDRAMSFEGSLRGGTALKGFVWRDSVIRNCVLRGLRGLEAGILTRGTITGNRVWAAEWGMHAFWLHESLICENKVGLAGSSDDVGFSFGGVYRARFERNHVRARIGVSNTDVVQAMVALDTYVTEMTHSYATSTGSGEAGPMDRGLAIWLLLEELVRACNLVDVQNQVQQLFDPTGAGQVPVLLLVSPSIARIIARWMQDSSGGGVIPGQELPMPLLALSLVGNDIVSSEQCVSLRNVLPLGGMKLADNHLHAESKQAVHLDANAAFVNPYTTIAAWRALLKWVIQLFEEVKSASSDVMEFLMGLFELWARQSEEFLEGDYRIESNSVHSRDTAIESNLFGLAILDNHITLLERSISNEDTLTIAQAMDKNDFLQPVAVALCEGSASQMSKAIIGVMWSESVLAALESEGLSEALLDCKTITDDRNITDEETSQAFENLARAVNAVDLEAVRGLVPVLLERLKRYVSGYGIWVKGAGCRIIGNRVVVPADTEPDRWARGGIRVWDDKAIFFRSPGKEPSPSYDVRAAAAPSGGLAWSATDPGASIAVFPLVPDLEFDPLLGITETLIDDNEIVGGVCHGVEIKGIAEPKGLFDLKIRGNQIHGMAGAGILIGEEALIVGLDVEGNHIADCSATDALAGLTDPDHGGLVIRNAGLCRIQSNRIQHCGRTDSMLLTVSAVDLEAIYDLTLADNHVLQAIELHTIGTVMLSQIYGQISLHNNKVLALAHYGVKLTNEDPEDTSIDEQPLWKQLIDQLSIYMGIDELPPAWPQMGFSWAQVSFSGNHVKGGFVSSVNSWVRIENIDRGVVANNVLDGLAVVNVGEGVVTGNTCQFDISVVGSGVTYGLNYPGVA